MPFDEMYARHAIGELKERGVAFTEGLDESDLHKIESAVEAPVPPELRTFWRIGLPTGEGFPLWRENSAAEAADSRKSILHAITFDIEQGQYWYPDWGPRPAKTSEAVDVARAQLAGAPPMIRVYGHRFMTTEPAGWGNPVLSVFQAVDSIYYGFDLADYLAKEFKITRPEWAASIPPRVPFWGGVFDLLQEQGLGPARA